MLIQQWQEKEPPPGYYEEKPTYNQLENSNTMFMIIGFIVIIWLMLRKSKSVEDK